ncbi:ribose transport system permease protein [Skermanella aerolata]|uniref:ABC transporter permease n=1 Tax=Skermanella aerolata TaxID=393310 RepID=UPI003D239C94
MNTVRLRLALLRNAPVALFIVVLAVFGSLSDRFLDVQNFTNILIQAAHIAILGIGMTFVLLTAGIDLSVGAVMYLSVALLGIYLADASPILAVPAMMAVGALFGLVNAFFVVRLRVAAFIVTLATLFIGRGLALWVTETRMVFYKDQVLSLARAEFLGVPWAIWVFAIVFAVAWIVLNHTPFGRQVYAVGENPDAAAKAGINVPLVLTTVYAVSGACAGIAGFVSITQVGAAASSFAMEKEFAAVAASVLGGVSLFGGRGGVAGTVFGAVLIQTVQNGLVIVNADPYIYPLVTSSIIFVAVFVDSQRSRILERLGRRRIRIEERPV